MPELRLPSSAASPPLSASERLILSALRAARVAREPTAELREAVGDYARKLRARGQPPERVLVAVKALLAQAGVRRTGVVAHGRSPAELRETELVDRVVAWAIDAYFPATPNDD